MTPGTNLEEYIGGPVFVVHALPSVVCTDKQHQQKTALPSKRCRGVMYDTCANTLGAGASSHFQLLACGKTKEKY